MALFVRIAKQAQSRSIETRAALLPNVDAAFSDQSRTENLAALGFNPSIFSQLPLPNFSFPTFVGPFTTVDARVTGSQSVFDFSTIRRFQASKVGVSAIDVPCRVYLARFVLLIRRCALRSLRIRGRGGGRGGSGRGGGRWLRRSGVRLAAARAAVAVSPVVAVVAAPAQASSGALAANFARAASRFAVVRPSEAVSLFAGALAAAPPEASAAPSAAVSLSFKPPLSASSRVENFEPAAPRPVVSRAVSGVARAQG